MAIKINTTLTDPTGGSDFTSGSYMIFDTHFIAGTTDIHYNMSVYRSKEDYDGGMRPIKPTEINRYSHIESVDVAVYTGLTNIGVQGLLQTHVETMVGSGNTSIVI